MKTQCYVVFVDSENIQNERGVVGEDPTKPVRVVFTKAKDAFQFLIWASREVGKCRWQLFEIPPVIDEHENQMGEDLIKEWGEKLI
jgi:hypothetical protein